MKLVISHFVIFLAVMVAFDLADAAPRKTSGAHLKLPGPAVQDLMLGTWAIQVKYEPSSEMPKGGKAAGKEIWRAGPGGNSVIEEYYEKNAKGIIKEFIIAWWDKKAEGQRYVACDNEMDGCEISRSVAKWEGNSLVYTEDVIGSKEKLFRQEIFTDITPSSFTQLVKEGPSVAGLKTTIAIQATKLSSRTEPMSF